MLITKSSSRHVGLSESTVSGVPQQFDRYGKSKGSREKDNDVLGRR